MFARGSVAVRKIEGSAAPLAPTIAGAVAGAVLAGGESRRMGRPKAILPLWDGDPMVAHVIRALTAVCGSIVSVGGTPTDFGGVLHLPDPVRGRGPLAAMATLLSSAPAKAYLIVACDQPLITPELLRLLLPNDSHDAQTARLFCPQEACPVDPFPGYYPATLYPVIQRVLSDDRPSVQKLIRSIPVTWVSLPDFLRPCLKSINTPEEFGQLLKRHAMD
jgi:molybdopterin-guanine dinucleotide biosynthesis protein A